MINSDLPVCEESLAKRASDVYFEAQRNPPCLQPCCTAEIDVNNKFTTVMEDGSTELEFRFPPTIKFYVEIEVYGLVSMLAGLAPRMGNQQNQIVSPHNNSFLPSSASTSTSTLVEVSFNPHSSSHPPPHPHHPHRP